ALRLPDLHLRDRSFEIGHRSDLPRGVLPVLAGFRANFAQGAAHIVNRAHRVSFSSDLKWVVQPRVAVTLLSDRCRATAPRALRSTGLDAQGLPSLVPRSCPLQAAA